MRLTETLQISRRSGACRRLATPGLIALSIGFSCASAAAAQSPTFNVNGRGWGHGIGMSQYGALGYAMHGWSYKAILKHYYKGTYVGGTSEQGVRVILRQSVNTVDVSGATLATGGAGLDANTRYTVARAGDSIQLQQGADVIRTYSGPLLLTSGGGATTLYGVAMNGRRDGSYRGGFEFRTSPFGGMSVVDVLTLDDYVKGVVPGEVPSSWERETLRAQAVASRSYAVTRKAGGKLFDQFPDTRSQMYLGASAETDATNAAVQDTSGRVVKYKGKTATTYFTSTSGGRTENIENIWTGSRPVPYLKSVADPYDTLSPYHQWSFTISRDDLEAKLGPYVKGTLRRIKVTKRGVSPRVVRAVVIGTRGRKQIAGTELRERLGLRDTWVTITRVPG